MNYQLFNQAFHSIKFEIKAIICTRPGFFLTNKKNYKIITF
jgi:hypothetical protein